MTKIRFALALACTLGTGLFVQFPSAFAANLLTDGGFEQPVVGPGGLDSGFQLFSVGQTIGSAWTVVGSPSGNVAVYPSTEFTCCGVTFGVQEGSQALDLTGGTDSGCRRGSSRL